MKKRLLLVVCILITGMSFMPDINSDEPISGSTLYVGGSGPGNYSSIQEAIDAASSGDTIFVYEGEYYESIVVDKTIDIFGENKYNTIIKSPGDAINILADWVNISGICIKESGNGISIQSSHNWIYDNNISSNRLSGIRMEYCNNNSIIDNNISSNAGNGIWMNYVTEDNIIRNNTFLSNGIHGIDLWYSENDNVIKNNTFKNNNEYGLLITHTDYANIANNSFYNNGIVIGHYSYINIIQDNYVNDKPLVYLESASDQIIDNAGQIILNYCDNITVDSIDLTNGSVGVTLLNSVDCKINNNNCSDNIMGIYLWKSNNNMINGNLLSNCGLYVEDSFNNNVINNIGNGKPIAYMEDESNKIVNSDSGQIILVNCNEITIKNQQLSNVYLGIELWYSDNCTIQDNSLNSNFYAGLMAVGTDSNIISKNDICYNKMYGLYIADSKNSTIDNNKINYNNWDGVYLRFSQNNTISNNNLSDNGIGVDLYGYGSDTEYNVLKNNDISNTICGFYLGDSVNNNTFSNNSITSNNRGFSIWNNCNNNSIIGNNISKNDIGLEIFLESNNNIFCYNNFINQNLYHAEDNCENIWDNGYPFGGNYWDDYTGTDSDDDSIGDTPYLIPGGSNQDNYPLMDPWNVGNQPANSVPKIDIPYCLPTEQRGYIGSTFQFIFNLTNVGTDANIFDLEVADADYAWDYSFSDDSIYLDPGETVYIKFNITGTDVETNNILIRATSQSDQSEFSEISVRIMITDTNPLMLNWLRSPFSDGTQITDSSFYVSDENIPDINFNIFFDMEFPSKDVKSIMISIGDTSESFQIEHTLPDFDVYTSGYHVWNDGYNFPNTIFDPGLCYGMVDTSILYFHKILNLPSGYDSLISVPVSDDIISIIRLHHNIGKFYSMNDYYNIFYDASQEFNTLKNKLRMGKPALIDVMYPKNLFSLQIHALLVYKIVESGDSAYFYVYDPNIPDDNTNPIHMWNSYCVYNQNTETFNYGNYDKFYYSNIKYYSNNKIVSLYCPVNVSIIDQFGRRINDTGVNEIPNAKFNLTNDTKIFSLPDDLNYSIIITAYDTGSFNLSIGVFNDSLIEIIEYYNTSITSHTKAYTNITRNQSHYLMEVDENGDGIIDQFYQPDIQVNYSINHPPNVDFSISKNSPTTDDTITFTDNSIDSDGSIDSWFWDFGDGIISTLQNPTHQYTQKGSYTVILMVEDNNGTSNMTTRYITVSKPSTDTTSGSGGGGGPPIGPTNTNPVANLSTDKSYQGTVGEEIIFDGSNSYDPDGDNITYSWDFGDNATGYGIISSHSYSAPGTYTVLLTVEDEFGATDTDETQAIIVKPNIPPTKPTISGVSTGNQNIEYSFIFSSTDNDNDTIQYEINWGDGTTKESSFLANGTTYNSTHAWTTAGIYAISVTATDNETESGTSTLSVYIDVTLVEDIGYLKDIDSDGNYDSFYNISSKVETDIGMKDSKYLIDENGDGNWDYIFTIDGGMSSYVEQKDEVTPGFEMVILIVTMVFFLYWKRRDNGL